MSAQNQYRKRPDPEDKNSFKDYFQFGEVFGYFFRKKDPNRPSNFNIRMMHGINKISIIIFLLGILFIIVKKIIM
ncbi:MAG: hypothetical protein M3421_08260 [Bacteroidota bacterium]|jgi:hypothetical protein|nr:hypothetical protein [Bacteroidota bacterium]